MVVASRVRASFVSCCLLVALAGCEDPAKDKPKATVSSAAPAATPTTAAGSATPAATGEAPSGAAIAVDPAASSIGFTGSKVTGSHSGNFQKFTGSVTLNGDKIEGGKVAFEVETASVKSDDEKLDGHLKSPDFFDVEKFPKASFSSTEIKAGGEKGASHTVTGELDLHGVKKTISFPATITVSPEQVSGTSEFSINRKDFGIVYPGKAEDLIRDDVVLKLSLKAPRKKG
jgi:polyisoprenoid-binding protein YceI